MTRTSISISALIALISVSSQPISADGVLEINQACAVNSGCFPDDAAGFPVEINGSAGKSYRLTSDLDLSAVPDTTAIQIDASFVTLDLNGFEIAGPVTCTGSGTSLDCGTPGSAAGIRVTSSNYEGVLIRNGTIRNMKSSGVSSGGNRVTLMQLRAFNNARNGFRSGEGSIAVDCIAARNGDNGFDFGVTSVIERSTAQGNGDDGFEIEFQRGVVKSSTARFNGGRGFNLGHSAKFRDNTAGFNEEPDRCGGGICSEMRRYYRTNSLHQGDSPRDACAAGFHMASLWEIRDTTGLAYDTVLGQTFGDSGSGPPTCIFGSIGAWVRTGSNNDFVGVEGDTNCDGYTQTTGEGTIAELWCDWDDDVSGANSDPDFSIFGDWRVDTRDCAASTGVWCVEN